MATKTKQMTKSQLVTELAGKLGSVWQFINDPQLTVFYFHDSATMSSKTLRKIQGILQRPLFSHFFGELVPSSKDAASRWNREEIELVRKSAHSEASVWAQRS